MRLLALSLLGAGCMVSAQVVHAHVYLTAGAAPHSSSDHNEQYWSAEALPAMPPEDGLQAPQKPALESSLKSLRDPSIKPRSSRAHPKSIIRAGTDVRQFLENAAREHGVEFVWDAGGQRFLTNRAVRKGKTFEDNVRVVLDQFIGFKVRPVAKLYLANENRKDTLVISVD